MNKIQNYIWYSQVGTVVLHVVQHNALKVYVRVAV
jgi:hypothetical protein